MKNKRGGYITKDANGYITKDTRNKISHWVFRLVLLASAIWVWSEVFNTGVFNLLRTAPEVGETWVIEHENENPFRIHPNDTMLITGVQDGYVRYFDTDEYEGSLMTWTFKMYGHSIPDSESPFIYEIKIKK